MQTRRHQRGFILIELVTTLILIGVIGAVAGLFLHTGIEGFIASRRNSEVALKAQIAVDRLSAELRHITQVTDWTPASFSYRCSDLPGTRKLIFDTDAHEIRISIDTGLERVLVDELNTYILDRDVVEIDRASDNKEEIKSITVGFTLKDVGRLFKVFIFPRHLVTKPA